MKKVIFIILSLVIVGWNFCPSSLFACSVPRNFILPTNYDLVKYTHGIVLAEAISSSNLKQDDLTENVIGFKILKVLKGNIPIRNLEVAGYLDFSGRSKEGDFSNARPGAYSGSCIAMDYRLHHKYVLFLENTQGEWRILFTPFSRVNEEVEGMDSPWVKAIEQYIAISSLNNYEKEKDALKQLIETSSQEAKSQTIPGLVPDVISYFKRPSQYKSFKDNLELFKNAKTEDEKARVLWAYANGKDVEAKPLIKEMFESGEWKKKNYIFPICAFVRETKSREFFPILAETFPEMKGWGERRSILAALRALANQDDSSVMLNILKRSKEEEASALVTWFVQHPSKGALEHIRSIVRGQYQEKWKLAFGLAGMGDVKVVKWAKNLLKTPDEHKWMGYYIIARSPLLEADVLAQQIIKEKDAEHLVFLIQGYKDSFNPHRWQRINDIIQLKLQNDEVNYWLKTTLESMASKGEMKAKKYLKLLE